MHASREDFFSLLAWAYTIVTCNISDSANILSTSFPCHCTVGEKWVFSDKDSEANPTKVENFSSWPRADELKKMKIYGPSSTNVE